MLSGVKGAVIAWIAFGLACLACALLSLSQRRNYQRVFADTSGYERRRRPLRLSGYGCLLLSLWPSVRLSGPWMGLVLWVAMPALAAFAQAMLLTYRPRFGALLAALGVALIVLGWLL